MSLFGEVFHRNASERRPSDKENESRHWKDIIHVDFKHVENGWHGNSAFVEHFKDGTLPGYSREFKITDREINAGMLEEDECRFPIKIKRTDHNEYWVYAYTKNSSDTGNIDNWIAHYLPEKRGYAA